ncbi:hypothetical protein JDN40_07440 [Rhodomicrobium vannielii ATCC 17100]|jgi:hypothetical protein|uniref:hypothetical protein n=1 Tax=Rhodomicrobium vannielii TaxID=1069 RepID=UPI00191898C5|nr:hypothetical protein [Rhodomicrobium vannielii]MBJ7533933.1 hypothetical protein [Rhodomicrobium vannielii ATCC 17100]
MNYMLAALMLSIAAGGSPSVSASEAACSASWTRGTYKTYQQIQDELRDRLRNAKILKLSLCATASEPYFQATILNESGKVVIVKLAAR